MIHKLLYRLTRGLKKVQPYFLLQILMMVFFMLPCLIVSTDIGLIGFFQGACPEGWLPWTKAPGRVIVLEGYATFSGVINNFSMGQTGGEHTHTLTVEEMAKHWHQQGDVSIFHSFGGGTYSSRGGYAGDEHEIWYQIYTSSVGDSQPFNVRDPYYVLKACQKTNETSSSGAYQSEISSLQLQIEALRKNITELNGKVDKTNATTIITEQKTEIKVEDNYNLAVIATVIAAFTLVVEITGIVLKCRKK